MNILDKFKLDGRVALVTGASSGLGQAMAIALAQAGANVAVHSHFAGEADETCATIAQTGRETFAVCGDMSDKDAPKRLVEEVVGKFGRIDVLINNAGTIRRAPRRRFHRRRLVARPRSKFVERLSPFASRRKKDD